MKREDLLKVAKPILFNTEMVKAILEGRKTQTRRVVKPRSSKACGFYVVVRQGMKGVYDYDENEKMFDNPQPLPYYPGDILYVRETWAIDNANDEVDFRLAFSYKASENEKDRGFRWVTVSEEMYDKYEPDLGCYFDSWRPSIHMPKEAARIFLKVTDVRVERLRDITVQDCIKEGVNEYHLREIGGEFVRGIFNEIWDSTIKKADRDKYSWKANPYVWVVEFERLEADNERDIISR